MNRVKSNILEAYANTDTVIDLASGKGQDLNKYKKNNIKTLICIDNDIDSIDEIISRKHEMSESKDQKNPMQIYTRHLNLTDGKVLKNMREILAKCNVVIPTNGVKLVVCNLALHYLLSDKHEMSNMMSLINDLVEAGGCFMYTAFDGKKVFDLLTANDGLWTSKENGIVKYELKFHGLPKVPSTLLNVGQKIDVLLPFSATDYYTENLIDNDFLEKQFTKIKMHKVLYECFST